MPALLVKLFASKWLRAFLPWIAAIAALIGIWLYIGNLKSTVREQQGAINVLTVKLDTEEQARKRDVAGLTALAEGQAKVALQSRADTKILTETIDHANPPASSAGLSALLNGLRLSDQQHATPASPSR